jgi:branched-chain amino acid transport system substrate-binding protein
MKRRSWKILAAVAALSVIAMAPASAQDVIKIGVTAPITGGLSSIYSIQGKLWDAWTQAQNEAGGIFVKPLNKKLPIKIVYYDDKSDPKVSVKFYERLISEDKVDFLMGPPGSPIAFAASTVAERYKFPMIHGAASDPQIFARGFHYIQGVLGPATDWSHYFFEMLGKEGKVKTAALVVEDSLYSRGVAVGVRQLAEKNGIKIVVDQTIPADNQDFTAITSQIKQANPDLVYVATFPPFYIRFAKQAAELGLHPKALHCSTCSAVSVRNGLGAEANGITGEVFWIPGMKLGDYKMLERALEISGLDPVQWTFALISIPALEVIRVGIEKAGTLDREAVYAAIQSNEIPTVMGTFKAMGKGIGTLNPLPMQVQDGKVGVIFPPEAKTMDYKFPRN